MKKIFIITFLIIGFSVTSFGQQKKGDVEFGFNLGYNFSKITNMDDEYTDTGSGINLGASAEYYFSNRWGIKGKLIYDQKGWDNDYITNLDTGETYDTDVNLNYLTIPIMANWHFGSKRNWYLNFGVYTGMLLNASETTFETDLKEAFSSVDFGLTLGIGVKIPVSNKVKISLEYDDQSGLFDIFSDNTNVTATNSRGAFNVGINFLMK